MPVVTIVAHPTLDASKVAAAAHEAVKSVVAVRPSEMRDIRTIELSAIVVSSGVVMRGGKPAKVLVQIDYINDDGFDDIHLFPEIHKRLLPLGVAAGEITGMSYSCAGHIHEATYLPRSKYEEEHGEWRRLNRNTAATMKPAMHMQKQQPAMDKRSRDMLIIVVGIVVVVVAYVALTFI